MLAATYSLAGKEEKARELITELLKNSPQYSLKQFAQARLYWNPEENERLVAAVRKAGLRD